MERKQGLSLGNWPRSTILHDQQQLTPITKRILAQVHMKPLDLLPISFMQYTHKNREATGNNEEDKENYRMEMDRRIKQVAILTRIRDKYILGNDYNSSEVVLPSKPRLLIKSRQNSRRSKATSQEKQEFSNVKLRSALSRNKSQKNTKISLSHFHKTAKEKEKEKEEEAQKQDSDYFVLFNPHKTSHKKNLQKATQQGSTRSRRLQRAPNTQESYNEYGTIFAPKSSKLKRKNDQQQSRLQHDRSKDLCHQLLLLTERWQQLDRNHLHQMLKMQALNPRQRERLNKMHQIQKQQMWSRIKRIRSRLKTQSIYGEEDELHRG